MEQGQAKGSVGWRRLCGFTLLFVSAGMIAVPVLTRSSVSAGQSAAPESAQAHPEFPAGEGRDTTLRLCVRCHSPNIILASGQTRLGWENTITKMVRLGATGEDEDFAEIADYLTKNFPPTTVQKIFVNMAKEDQLVTVLGLSESDAKAIIAYRDKVKGFKSLDEMKQVPDVDTKKLDAKKDLLVFGAGSTIPAAAAQ